MLKNIVKNYFQSIYLKNYKKLGSIFKKKYSCYYTKCFINITFFQQLKKKKKTEKMSPISYIFIAFYIFKTSQTLESPITNFFLSESVILEAMRIVSRFLFN